MATLVDFRVGNEQLRIHRSLSDLFYLHFCALWADLWSNPTAKSAGDQLLNNRMITPTSINISHLFFV